jgi:hypothetical protein
MRAGFCRQALMAHVIACTPSPLHPFTARSPRSCSTLAVAEPEDVLAAIEQIKAF